MSKKKRHVPYITFKRTLAGLGLTYTDVARVIGTTASTVQLKINGDSDFYLSEQRAICEAFGIQRPFFLPILLRKR